MIRTRISVSFPRIPDMQAVTRAVARQAVASAPVQRAFARGIAEPPRAQKLEHPTEHMTEKQRKYLYAVVKLPYQRRGDVTDAWRLLVVEVYGAVQIVLMNRSRAARWVHGTARGKDQQEFHRLSGWTRTPDIKRAVFEAAIDEMRRLLAPNLRREMEVR